MLFDFSLKSSILLIFFVHGVVFSGLLLEKGLQTQNRAHLWLSGFVFLCSLYITPFMLGYAGWYAQDGLRDILFYVPFQQLLLIGPVLFVYVQTLLDKSFVFSKKQALHFLPALVYGLYSLLVFVVDRLVLGEYYFYADGRDKDLDPWYQVAGLLSMAVYLFLSLRYYLRYRRIAFEVVSFAEAILFRWIQRFLIAFLIILLLRVLFFILNPEWGEFGSKFWYYLCFSLLFYYISIHGYANSVQALVPLPEAPEIAQAMEAEDIARIHPEESSLDMATLQIWKEKIEQIMAAERLYENPVLTVADLAQRLQTSPRQVSQLVNQGFQLNFNDFVNQYRTHAVVEKLKRGEQQSKTLLAIAYECGFNSKSTFNRAFKKATSLTPKDYLEKMAQKEVPNPDLERPNGEA